MEHVTMRLYWVSTKDHDADWFVVAENAPNAAAFYADAEGYDSGNAAVEFVINIPDDLPAEKGWPPDGLLLSLGGEFVYESMPRVVALNGRIYVEGGLESELGGSSNEH